MHWRLVLVQIGFGVIWCPDEGLWSCCRESSSLSCDVLPYTIGLPVWSSLQSSALSSGVWAVYPWGSMGGTPGSWLALKAAQDRNGKLQLSEDLQLKINIIFFFYLLPVAMGNLTSPRFQSNLNNIYKEWEQPVLNFGSLWFLSHSQCLVYNCANCTLPIHFNRSSGKAELKSAWVIYVRYNSGGDVCVSVGRGQISSLKKLLERISNAVCLFCWKGKAEH